MVIRNYHWDVVDDCVMTETDQNGNTIVTYTHEPGPFGPLISENRDSGWTGLTDDDWSALSVDNWGNLPVSNPTEFCHHHDALGSTTMLTDETGTVTDTFEYDAWGNVVARTETTPTPYQWVGRWGYQYDTSTGDYFIRARTYQPIVARWSGVDPLDHIDITNSFQYGDASPVSAIDPSGLLSILDVIDRFLPVLPHIAGGPCGSGAWRLKVDGTIIPSVVGVSLAPVNIFQNFMGPVRFPKCPDGSKCCLVVLQNTFTLGRLKGAITGIRIRTWVLTPSVSFNIGFSLSEQFNIGICIANQCPCPRRFFLHHNIYLPDIDLGTIKYPPPPFPPLEPDWLQPQ